MKSKTGFTKRDVMVVLGCALFVLMNIGSVGSSGRKRAKEAVCLSNLRQWGDIFQAFTDEHDGYFMHGWYSNPSNPSAQRESWPYALRSYVDLREDRLACCPMAINLNLKSSTDMQGSTFTPWGGPAPMFSFLGGEVGDYSSYATNSYIYNKWEYDSNPTADDAHWKRVDAAGAENIPIFADGTYITGAPWHGQGPPEWEGATHWSGALNAGGMGIFCINRHNAAVNVLFMDFSARKVALKELWTLKWSREFNVNGPWTIAGGVTPQDWANSGTGWMENFKDF